MNINATVTSLGRVPATPTPCFFSVDCYALLIKPEISLGLRNRAERTAKVFRNYSSVAEFLDSAVDRKDYNLKPGSAKLHFKFIVAHPSQRE